MRILLLLRGSAGCGKSTWIQQKGLKIYTLSADDIRILCQSPIMHKDGTEAISQSNDKIVWKLVFQILEVRMEKGEFTVIDATNSKTSEINRYKELCGIYRYRLYCVDFTDIPVEEVKRRNAGREPLRRVPEETIDRMYSRFATQKIPSGVKVIRPDELDSIWLKRIDLSEYDKIHHIGDVHGCNTVLQKYLSDNGGLKENEFYIFLGDYIDRGIENAETVNFLISIKDKKNVLMLEGNHERWLWAYANDENGRSREFVQTTKPALEKAKVSKKEIRQLYRKLGQCAYYEYNGKVFLATHAGLSTIPENLSFVATEQMIKGAGGYDDFEKVAETFFDTTPENFYQIHGHRNTKQAPVMINDRVFNLEGQVEFGGCLRCVQVDREGIHIVETPNEVFEIPETETEQTEENISVNEMILALRTNNYIQEKKFGNISSFNFTEKAFYEKEWNEQTTKARGLYLDTEKGTVAARAYTKFFNINERPETKFDRLQYKLKFPVTAYVKENGFLGIVSFDEYEDDLFVATKSTTQGLFAQWLKEMLYEKVSPENIKRIKEFCKENQVTMVFECVDMKHDPHIVEYPKSELFLLDIVKNQLSFAKYEYDHVRHVAEQFGLAHKEKAFEIPSWQEFFDWYYKVTAEDYEYNGRKIEGFVIEDSEGYMTKLKLSYYNFWKFMRSVARESIRKGYIAKTSALTTPTANAFYGWVRKLHDAEDVDSVPKDICTLRRMFYEETEPSL